MRHHVVLASCDLMQGVDRFLHVRILSLYKEKVTVAEYTTYGRRCLRETPESYKELRTCLRS